MTFVQDMRKPYNVFTTLLAVLGIFFSIWFFYLSQERREPYYIVNDSIQIFDSQSSLPSIKVNDKAGRPVTDSIYVAEILFWNAGKRSIEKEDIRVPISIQLSKAKSIIDVMVVKQTKPEILDFSVSANHQEKNVVDISFKHLDPGLGARIKVVYTGVEDPGVVFRGSILGAGFSNGSSLARRVFSNKITLFLSALLGAVLAQIVGTVEKRLIVGDISSRRRKITTALALFIFILILMVILKIFFASKVAPI